MDTPLIDQINAELQRFDLEEGDLDAWPVTEGDLPRPDLVMLADTQETTICHAAPLLQALESLPDGAGWDDIWQVVIPTTLAEPEA